MCSVNIEATTSILLLNCDNLFSDKDAMISLAMEFSHEHFQYHLKFSFKGIRTWATFAS